MAVLLEHLLKIPALETLCSECLVALSENFILRTYRPNEFIFLEGEDANGIWFVYEGRVRITKYGLNGRTQLLCFLHNGKCFGTCPLFNRDMLNPATAQAMDEVRLLILPRYALQNTLTNNPDLVRALLQLYRQHLSQLARLSECLGSWSTAQRINDTLVSFAPEPLNQIRMTHEQIAEVAGTVREVVSRHLNKLEKQGLVQLESGCITLLDRAMLEQTCLANMT